MSFIPIFDAIKPVIDKALSFIPDPQEREKQQEFLINSLKDWDAQQAAINQAEAANENVFVSGWRPFIGWVCGFAFAYHFIFQPLLIFILASFGRSVSLPDFDIQELIPVLMGMLGLGGLRTLEKIKGV